MIVNFRKSRWISLMWVYDVCEYIGLSDYGASQVHDFLYKYLLINQINKILQWWAKPRFILEGHDTWSLDYTLAPIILEGLKRIKDINSGSPFVDYDDVPEYLRPSYKPDDSWCYVDHFYHARWRWVLNEMIFAFECKTSDNYLDEYYTSYGEYHSEELLDSDLNILVWDRDSVVDRPGIEAIEKRIQNGFKLFGKYYQNLWT